MRWLVWGGVRPLGILLIALLCLNLNIVWAENRQLSLTTQKKTVVSNAAAVSEHKHDQKSWQSEFLFKTGTRSDDLDWSIAASSNRNNPNVLSELTWTDVDSYQISLTNRSRFRRHLYFRSSIQYAWINDGSLRDSDYGQNNRTAEWSRSISESNDDEVWDFSAGGGYAFVLLDSQLVVAPLIGLSYHEQNLRIANGTQVVSADNPFSSSDEDNPPAVGALPSNLNSSYFARWKGPWIGCDLHYQPKDHGPRFPPMLFSLSLEYHMVDYYGEGNWNLRSDLAHPKSFEHDADGYGLCFGGEWLISLTHYWDLSFDVRLQNWSTGSGTDRKFWRNGGSASTRLNGVNWDSSSFMVGAACHF